MLQSHVHDVSENCCMDAARNRTVNTLALLLRIPDCDNPKYSTAETFLFPFRATTLREIKEGIHNTRKQKGSGKTFFFVQTANGATSMYLHAT